ncbi:DnaJ domain protein [Symmachiella macrocystis]|uniref:DnaJ domain protein n=1 Tax=Symmachiella macrocystis TaxID=2527985 RepID=A0A5C6AZM8_9PLAN|nr:J domain-containing protein [Symmachiella macrocystis]TWU05170.1 DnaJ domain protein [Symmachiella macrocystis]
MTDIPLPDDSSQWPLNPWEIFGLRPNAKHVELRRAYSQLIRRFRPDTHPVEFQRIHEAYQRLKAILGSQVQPELPSHGNASNENWSHGGSPHGYSPYGNSNGNGKSPYDSPIDPNVPSSRNEIRKRAPDVGGLFAIHDKKSVVDAYRSLVQADKQHPSETTAAALYWQLILNPDLDTQRKPADWLLHGLSRTNGSPCLLELFRQELICKPRFALSDKAGQFLKRIPASFRSELLRQRWKHAATAKNWQVIREDLVVHRTPLVDYSPTEWVRLTIAAANHAAWSQDSDAVRILDTCRKEIALFDNFQLELESELIQFDHLTELATGIKSLPTVGNIHVRLLLQEMPNIWNASNNVRSAVVPIISGLLSKPETVLSELDQVASVSPVVLQYLYGLLDQVGLAWIEDRDRPAETVVAERIVYFLTVCPVVDYSKLRTSILRFCIDEFISPEEFAATVEAQQDEALEFDGSKTLISSSIRDDLSLRFLCKAHRALNG